MLLRPHPISNGVNLMANHLIIAIVGPNGSGKSELAVQIAKKFNGEIISADSRQVYRYLDIGTGKVEGRWRKNKLLCFFSDPRSGIFDAEQSEAGNRWKTNPKSEIRNPKQIPNSKPQIQKYFVYKNIVHHCIDFVNPKKVFTAQDFKKCAEKAIEDILKKGKLPIICGGTGFYIDVALGNIKIPEAPPDWKLRRKLERKSAEELFKMLKKLNPERAKDIDSKNKRRLIRAIEIANSKNKECARTDLAQIAQIARSVLAIGISRPPKVLKKRIEKRLLKQLKQGLIEEVKNLRYKKKLSWKRLDELGLEYRWTSYFLQKKIPDEELVLKLTTEIWRYAKRQRLWFNRNKEIHWVKNEKEAKNLVSKFLKSR